MLIIIFSSNVNSNGSAFEIYMKMFEQHYCIGTCNSESKRISSSNNSNVYRHLQNHQVQRSSSQAPLDYAHILNNSSSSNRYSLE